MEANSYLSDESGQHLREVTLVSVILGLLYGFFVSPMTQEIAEWAMLYTGKIPVVATNAYVLKWHSEPTVQTILPAFLLKLGVGQLFLTNLTSAIVCATSFCAVALVAYLFSRSALLSMAMPLLLLGWDFPNSHFYPVWFPIAFPVFGHYGMYFTILTLTLFAFDKRKTGFLCWGLLVGIHPSWAVAALVGISTLFLVEKRRPDRQMLKRFGLGILVSLVLVVAGKMSLKWDVRPGPSESEIKNFDARIGPAGLAPHLSERESRPSLPLVKGKRTTFWAHNYVMSNQAVPSWRLRDVMNFFFHPLAILLLLTLAWRYRFDIFNPSNRRFLWMLSGIASLVVCYQLVEEIDPDFRPLAWINQGWPMLLMRAIVNRWLNITTVVCPILITSIIFRKISHSAGWLSILALLSVFLFAGRPYYEPGFPYENPPLASLVVLFALLLLVTRHIENRIPLFLTKQRGQKIVFAMLGLFAVAKVGLLFASAAKEKKFLGVDEFSALSNFLKASKGDGKSVIISPFAHAYRGFNVQLRSERSYVIPNEGFRMTLPDGKTQFDPFCYDNPYYSYREFQDNVIECYAERKPIVWSFLGMYFNSNQVLARSEYKIDLPVVYRDETFTVYQIPPANF